MIDKESVEVFLNILSMTSDNVLNEVFGTNDIRQVLYNIDLDRDMERFSNYLKEFHIGDRVKTIENEITGAILFISEDKTKANVVMDSFNDIGDQVQTFNLTDLKKI